MYLDPGVGSVVLQVIIAGVLGVGVFIKLFWKKIKSFFGKKEICELKTENTEE
jgi:hypothetical protein